MQPLRRADRRSLAFAACLVAIVGVALAMRAPALTNGLPYPSYIDERFVLRPAALIYDRRTWDPAFYIYPPLVSYLTAGMAGVLQVLPGGSDVPPGATFDQPIRSNLLSPDLILAGRLVSLVASLVTIVVAGLLARRLMGRRAGVIAALLVAALPALLSRSAITIVDTPAALFATLCLLGAAWSVTSGRPTAWAVAGGAAAGLAAASKYTAGVVLLAVLVAVLLRGDLARRAQVRACLGAVAGAAIAFLVTAPTTLLRARTVVRHSRRNIEDIYETHATSSYWSSMLDGEEVGWLFLVVALLGLAFLVWGRGTRPLAIGFLVFAAALVLPLARYEYQPLRNLLPLLPFLAVAAACGLVGVADAAGRRFRLGRVAPTAIALGLAVVLAGSMTAASWSEYRSSRVDLEDARIEAREWLEQRTEPDQVVVVASELGFAPAELALVPARVVSKPLAEPLTGGAARADFIVVGDEATAERWRDALEGPAERAHFGRRPTLTHREAYRHPRQIVRVLEPRR